MVTRQATEVICDCPGGDSCPDRAHDADEPCENAVTIRTNRVAVARLTAMERHGFSVVPAPKGAYVVGDRCRPCTDWSDVETFARAGLRAMGWDANGLNEIATRIRATLKQDLGSL